MIRLMLVEDDEVFRIGVTVSLKQSPEIEIVGNCLDGKTAITMADELRPDLILMDIGLPVISGIEATRIIKTKHPEIKVLILTSHAESRMVEELMNIGADGYCLKGVSTERLTTLIQEVNQGAFWIDAAVAAQIKRYLRGDHKLSESEQLAKLPLEALKSLTEREQEVLALIAEGKKNPDIASILSISPGTVRVHVHSILNKLNVKDRTQAALFVVKRLEKKGDNLG
jgi:two-component system, NarL family, response regulator